MTRFWHFAAVIAASVRRRPITTTVFFASVGALLLLTYFLTSFLRVQERRISIGLFTPEEGAVVTSGHFSISKGQSSDEVYVSVGLSTRDVAKDGVFVLEVPDFFQVSKGPSLNAGIASTESYSRGAITHHFFRVRSGQSASVTMTFRADVLSSSARELDLRLTFETIGGRELPVSLMLSGLSQSDIVNVDPPPTDENRSSYALRWLALPRSVAGAGTLRLQLRDRAGGYRTDLLLLLAGIFTGIFSSLLTSILWDAAKEAEVRLSSCRKDHS